MALNGHLLTFLVFFPAAGALALLWLRGDDEVWIRRFTLVVSLVEFVASVLMLRAVPIGASAYSLEEFARWIPSPAINYHLGADGISLFLVILTTFLTSISVLASWKGVHFRLKEFHAILGAVTHEVNRELEDTSARENWMLVALAVVILWMGINSPFFTRRFAAPCTAVIEQMNPNVMHEAIAPTGMARELVHEQTAMERLASR
jgi:NADH:ubiquinone oxidoreductase subunit 4 (subunit M)